APEGTRDDGRADHCPRPRPPAGAVRRRPPRHRAVVRPVVAGGLPTPVDAGRQPGEVAPGAHDLVLRDVRPRASRRELSAGPPAVQLPVQLVLRGRRRPPPAAAAGDTVAARTGRGVRISCGRGRADGPAVADDWCGTVRGDRAGPDARPAPRAAASGTDPDGYSARIQFESTAAGIRGTGARGASAPRWNAPGG